MIKQRSTDPIEQMIEKYNIKTVEDMDVAMKDLFGKTVQTLLEKEIDAHLGYDKHSQEPKKLKIEEMDILKKLFKQPRVL
jgi:transposase-like protein